MSDDRNIPSGIKRPFGISFCLMLVSILLFSSFIFILDEPTTVSAQPVPEYRDSSNGLPTYSLWVSKIMFFDIDEDGTKDVFALGPRKGDGERNLNVWKWNGNSWVNENTVEGLGVIDHSSYGGYSFADFDNDGDWDIGVGSHGKDDVDAYMKLSQATYLESSTGLDTAEDGWNIDFGDFNSDGNMDLLETGFWGMDSRPFAGSGLGTWLEQSTGLPGGHTSVDGHFFDANNDGNLDIVASWGHEGWVYTGDGNGTWTNASEGLPYTWVGDATTWGDFNNDGFADIVITYDGHTQAYAGDGRGNWTLDSAGIADIQYGSVVLADMNNDKFDDLVGLTSTDPGYVDLYLYSGAGSWVKAQTTVMQGNAQGWRLNVGDFDNNGHNDITAGFGSDNDLDFPGSIKVWSETTEAADLGVTLTYPDGMEQFKEWSRWFVRWLSEVPAATGPVDVMLEYSTEGASGTWTVIAEDLPNTGVFQWEVPEILSDECYLRMTISDGIGNLASDMNDDAFGIGVNPSINHRPEITILEPSEENESADSEYFIEWNATDRDEDELTIDLYYDDDADPENGTNLIAEDLSNSGNFSWDTTEIDEGFYYIRGVVDDGNGKNSSAYSAGTVNITHNDPPSIEVTKPSEEEEEADESYTIEWFADDPDDDILTIDLYYDTDSDSGDGLVAIATDLNNTGSYEWDCSEVEEGTYHILGVADDGQIESSEYSQGHVIISHKGTAENHPPTIEILEPDGNADIADTSFSIEWDASDDDGDRLTIDLYYDDNDDPKDGNILIESGVANTGRFTWNTSEIDEGEYYIIGIADDHEGARVEDYSSGTVSISHDSSPPPDPREENKAPSINVTVEKLDDFTYAIRWDASDPDDDDLVIDLYNDDDTDPDNGKSLIVEELENTGYYEWDVTDIEEGDYFILAHAEDPEDAQGTNYSSEFTIQFQAMVPDFRITFFQLAATSNEPGENVFIQANVENVGDDQDQGTLIFTVDNLAIMSFDLDLKSGRDESFNTIWVASEGNHTIAVEAKLEDDPTPENNRDEKFFIVDAKADDKKGGEDDFPIIPAGIGILVLIGVFGGILLAMRRTDGGGERCKQCGGKTEYSEQYNDNYCWNCDEYIGEM